MALCPGGPSSSRVLLAAIFAAAAGCGSCHSAPVVEGAELLGFRALKSDGKGAFVPELDAEALPHFRYKTPVIEGLEAWLEVEGQRIRLELEPPEQREGHVIQRIGALPSPPPPGEGTLELGAVRWPVRWLAPPTAIDQLAEARARQKRGDLAGAREAYLARLPALPPRQRMIARGELAGLLRSMGDLEGSVAEYEQLAAEARAEGVLTEASRALRAAAYTEYYGRRFTKVEPLLVRAAELDDRSGFTLGHLRSAHYRGLVAQELGYYRRATEIFEKSSRESWRLGFDRESAMMTKALAPLSQDLGLHLRAREQLQRLGPYFEHRASREDRFAYWVDLGWVELRAMAQGAIDEDWSSPERWFDRARALARELNAPLKEANVVANQLWLAHLRADDATADRLLDELAVLDPGRRGYGDLFAGIIRADLALRRGNAAAAEAAYGDALERALAEAQGLPSDSVWRAQYGLGKAALARGQQERASELFAEAMTQLEQLGTRTDMRESRALFFRDRARLYGDAIRLQLASGKVAEAFRTSERHRTSVLRALEAPLRVDRLEPQQRERWQELRAKYEKLRAEHEATRLDGELLTGDARAKFEKDRAERRIELGKAFERAYALLDESAPAVVTGAPPTEALRAALGPDEAIWSVVSTAEGGIAFWVTRSSIHTVELGENPHAKFSPPVENERHVYVVGLSHEASAFLAAAPGGQPLITKVTVSFLPHAAALLVPTTGATSGPLVVADPDATLPEARREGEAVRQLLPGARALVGREATRAAFLEAAGGASLVHFAGHGVLRPNQPWDAQLTLAAGEALALEDLFIARPRIAAVVLSGCETGVAQALGGETRIGLPEAFLLSGARSVLATTRKVGDSEARKFIERFYAEGGAERPVTAYRNTALAFIAEKDPSWTAYYLLGRER